MTNYEKRRRVEAITKKVLGIKSATRGSKRKVLESHNHNKELGKFAVDIAKKRREYLGEYHVNDDIFEKLTGVFKEYEGKISLVTALGILDLVKDKLKGE